MFLVRIDCCFCFESRAVAAAAAVVVGWGAHFVKTTTTTVVATKRDVSTSCLSAVLSCHCHPVSYRYFFVSRDDPDPDSYPDAGADSVAVG